MTQEGLSNEEIPTESPGLGNNKWEWLAKNWLAFFSLAVALVGCGISARAMHVSWTSDDREQRMDAAEASAEATIIAGDTNEVFTTADMLQSIFTQAEQELSSDNKLGVFRDPIGRAQLPPLSATRDELNELARAGDSTAGHFALCVKWRNIAQANIESMVTLAKANDPRYEPLEAMYVHQINKYLSNVIKACGQAAVDIKRQAVPDPELDPANPQGKIERYQTILLPPLSSAGVN